MFKDTGIKGRLRLLVESESLLNDGVAAVLLGWAQATGEAATPMQVALGAGPHYRRQHLGGSRLRRSGHCGGWTNFSRR
jgi:hypothetical protein